MKMCCAYGFEFWMQSFLAELLSIWNENFYIKSLCLQFLLDASSNFLETLQVFLLSYEDVHVVLNLGFNHF